MLPGFVAKNKKKEGKNSVIKQLFRCAMSFTCVPSDPPILHRKKLRFPGEVTCLDSHYYYYPMGEVGAGWLPSSRRSPVLLGYSRSGGGVERIFIAEGLLFSQHTPCSGHANHHAGLQGAAPTPCPHLLLSSKTQLEHRLCSPSPTPGQVRQPLPGTHPDARR